eukprot:TRINITY_DN23437_c0_g1_i1.p1 TRINITY_DN23437_c0_g1~~TRINITY_DN23437_c0_g1_i1.p1  ORF type:complete len:2556 (+),score=547.58 TRINITY_DN23437_c0_g1_i1:131-7798(+)
MASSNARSRGSVVASDSNEGAASGAGTGVVAAEFLKQGSVALSSLRSSSESEGDSESSESSARSDGCSSLRSSELSGMARHLSDRYQKDADSDEQEDSDESDDDEEDSGSTESESEEQYESRSSIASEFEIGTWQRGNPVTAAVAAACRGGGVEVNEAVVMLLDMLRNTLGESNDTGATRPRDPETLGKQNEGAGLSAETTAATLQLASASQSASEMSSILPSTAMLDSVQAPGSQMPQAVVEDFEEEADLPIPRIPSLATLLKMDDAGLDDLLGRPHKQAGIEVVEKQQSGEGLSIEKNIKNFHKQEKLRIQKERFSDRRKNVAFGGSDFRDKKGRVLTFESLALGMGASTPNLETELQKAWGEVAGKMAYISTQLDLVMPKSKSRIVDQVLGNADGRRMSIETSQRVDDMTGLREAIVYCFGSLRGKQSAKALREVLAKRPGKTVHATDEELAIMQSNFNIRVNEFELGEGREIDPIFRQLLVQRGFMMENLKERKFLAQALRKVQQLSSGRGKKARKKGFGTANQPTLEDLDAQEEFSPQGPAPTEAFGSPSSTAQSPVTQETSHLNEEWVDAGENIRLRNMISEKGVELEIKRSMTRAKRRYKVQESLWLQQPTVVIIRLENQCRRLRLHTEAKLREVSNFRNKVLQSDEKWRNNRVGTEPTLIDLEMMATDLRTQLARNVITRARFGDKAEDEWKAKMSQYRSAKARLMGHLDAVIKDWRKDGNVHSAASTIPNPWKLNLAFTPDSVQSAISAAVEGHGPTTEQTNPGPPKKETLNVRYGQVDHGLDYCGITRGHMASHEKKLDDKTRPLGNRWDQLRSQHIRYHNILVGQLEHWLKADFISQPFETIRELQGHVSEAIHTAHRQLEDLIANTAEDLKSPSLQDFFERQSRKLNDTGNASKSASAGKGGNFHPIQKFVDVLQEVHVAAAHELEFLDSLISKTDGALPALTRSLDHLMMICLLRPFTFEDMMEGPGQDKTNGDLVGFVPLGGMEAPSDKSEPNAAEAAEDSHDLPNVKRKAHPISSREMAEAIETPVQAARQLARILHVNWTTFRTRWEVLIEKHKGASSEYMKHLMNEKEKRRKKLLDELLTKPHLHQDLLEKYNSQWKQVEDAYYRDNLEPLEQRSQSLSGSARDLKLKIMQEEADQARLEKELSSAEERLQEVMEKERLAAEGKKTQMEEEHKNKLQERLELKKAKLEEIHMLEQNNFDMLADVMESVKMLGKDADILESVSGLHEALESGTRTKESTHFLALRHKHGEESPVQLEQKKEKALKHLQEDPETEKGRTMGKTKSRKKGKVLAGEEEVQATSTSLDSPSSSSVSKTPKSPRSPRSPKSPKKSQGSSEGEDKGMKSFARKAKMVMALMRTKAARAKARPDTPLRHSKSEEEAEDGKSSATAARSDLHVASVSLAAAVDEKVWAEEENANMLSRNRDSLDEDSDSESENELDMLDERSQNVQAYLVKAVYAKAIAEGLSHDEAHTSAEAARAAVKASYTKAIAQGESHRDALRALEEEVQEETKKAVYDKMIAEGKSTEEATAEAASSRKALRAEASLARKHERLARERAKATYERLLSEGMPPQSAKADAAKAALKEMRQLIEEPSKQDPDDALTLRMQVAEGLTAELPQQDFHDSHKEASKVSLSADWSRHAGSREKEEEGISLRSPRGGKSKTSSEAYSRLLGKKKGPSRKALPRRSVHTRQESLVHGKDHDGVDVYWRPSDDKEDQENEYVMSEEERKEYLEKRAQRAARNLALKLELEKVYKERRAVMLQKAEEAKRRRELILQNLWEDLKNQPESKRQHKGRFSRMKRVREIIDLLGAASQDDGTLTKCWWQKDELTVDGPARAPRFILNELEDNVSMPESEQFIARMRQRALLRLAKCKCTGSMLTAGVKTSNEIHEEIFGTKGASAPSKLYLRIEAGPEAAERQSVGTPMAEEGPQKFARGRLLHLTSAARPESTHPETVAKHMDTLGSCIQLSAAGKEVQDQLRLFPAGKHFTSKALSGEESQATELMSMASPTSSLVLGGGPEDIEVRSRTFHGHGLEQLLDRVPDLEAQLWSQKRPAGVCRPLLQGPVFRRQEDASLRRAQHTEDSKDVVPARALHTATSESHLASEPSSPATTQELEAPILAEDLNGQKSTSRLSPVLLAPSPDESTPEASPTLCPNGDLSAWNAIPPTVDTSTTEASPALLRRLPSGWCTVKPPLVPTPRTSEASSLHQPSKRQPSSASQVEVQNEEAAHSGELQQERILPQIQGCKVELPLGPLPPRPATVIGTVSVRPMQSSKTASSASSSPPPYADLSPQIKDRPGSWLPKAGPQKGSASSPASSRGVSSCATTARCGSSSLTVRCVSSCAESREEWMRSPSPSEVPPRPHTSCSTTPRDRQDFAGISGKPPHPWRLRALVSDDIAKTQHQADEVSSQHREPDPLLEYEKNWQWSALSTFLQDMTLEDLSDDDLMTAASRLPRLSKDLSCSAPPEDPKLQTQSALGMNPAQKAQPTAAAKASSSSRPGSRASASLSPSSAGQAGNAGNIPHGPSPRPPVKLRSLIR